MATDPFAAALVAIFNSPMAAWANYTPAGGATVRIRVVRDQESHEVDLGQGSAILDGNGIQIQRSDAPIAPADGDAISILKLDGAGGIVAQDYFILQGDGELDVEGVTWRCGMVIVDIATLAGSVQAYTALTGSLSAAASLDGAISAQAAVTGALSVNAALAGQITAQSVLAGSLAANAAFSGAISAQSSVVGALAIAQPDEFLGASLLGFWDAERAGTITQIGGAVSAWADVVAGYTVTQAGASAKPVLSATGFNGRPVITFDGVDDFLEMAAVPFPTGAAPCEIWILVDQISPTSDAINKVAFSYGGDTTSVERIVGRLATGGVNRGYMVSGTGGAAPSATASGTVPFDGRHVVRGVVTATDFSALIDNTSAVTVATVSSTGTSRVRIGANSLVTAASFFKGGVNSVLVTAPLTTAQAARLLSFLKNRGGIA
jgi:hypothetical protein